MSARKKQRNEAFRTLEKRSFRKLRRLYQWACQQTVGGNRRVRSEDPETAMRRSRSPDRRRRRGENPSMLGDQKIPPDHIRKSSSPHENIFQKTGASKAFTNPALSAAIHEIIKESGTCTNKASKTGDSEKRNKAAKQKN